MFPQSPGISALRSNPLFLHSSANTAQQTHRLNEPWQMWSLISECKRKRNISGGRRANVQLPNVVFLYLLPVCLLMSLSHKVLHCVCAVVLDKQGGHDNSLVHSAPSIKHTYSCLKEAKMLFMSIWLHSSVSSFNCNGFMGTRHCLSCNITKIDFMASDTRTWVSQSSARLRNKR